jgi:hypothetical protein
VGALIGLLVVALYFMLSKKGQKTLKDSYSAGRKLRQGPGEKPGTPPSGDEEEKA